MTGTLIGIDYYAFRITRIQFESCDLRRCPVGRFHFHLGKQTLCKVAYRASTPQAGGSILGLGKVNSTFHLSCSGLIKRVPSLFGDLKHWGSRFRLTT
ncbi:hypothetical protein TNCV_3585711 [Trichonephila clavipes]|nr:hypothetical protein TNCV_3585711 [Trichonephila clavipes]